MKETGMHINGPIRKLVVIALAGALTLPLAACATGVPESEYEAVKQQLATQEKKVQALQQQLSAQAAAPAAGKALPNGLSVVLGAVVLTPAPPQPTATPLPPDAPKPTAPPPPALPAWFNQSVPIYIYADTVIGSGSKYNVAPQVVGGKSSCVLTGVFKRGMRIVFRFEAIDTSTGKRLSDADVASAVVHLPNGEDLTARFGRHGSTDDSPWFWAAAWDIPLDYPLGSLDWRIEVKTKDGRVGTFRQLQVYSDASDSRTQIVE